MLNKDIVIQLGRYTTRVLKKIDFIETKINELKSNVISNILLQQFHMILNINQKLTFKILTWEICSYPYWERIS
jgi:hypothetical protein